MADEKDEGLLGRIKKSFEPDDESNPKDALGVRVSNETAEALRRRSKKQASKYNFQDDY